MPITNGPAPIARDELARVLATCEDVNGGQPITFFEITTAAAYLAFAEWPADYLLLETGLGGRLDATNVIDRPALCVITQIDIDHEHFLGDTLTQIAGEKAGILKRGCPVVIAPQNEMALRVVEKQAQTLDCPSHIAGRDWQCLEQAGRLVFEDDNSLLDLPLPRLYGRHQIDNAGTAVASLRALDDPAITTAALEHALTATVWPGRLERLGPGRLYNWAPENCEIWLDGGHNAAAARALAASLADLEDRVPRPLVLIFGMLNTKDAAAFLQPFAGLAARVIPLDIPGTPNAQAAGDLCRIARDLGFPADPADSLKQALTTLRDEYPQSPRIAICGSLYLAGHALDLHGASTR
jgi:dihydrofolate synthase/folylpolyglutamate synthase